MAYAGFDRSDMPDLAMMARLKRETNLEWTGFYLPAPSHPVSTWSGKRAALVAQGWGLASLFVGQQVTGPGSHHVSMIQGQVDGVRACQAMRAEGFPAGSWVYLDLENGPPFTDAQREYVGAWVDTVDDNGYRAGVYCSYLFAAQVALLRPSARIWTFHVMSVQPHPVNGTLFPAPDPRLSGYHDAVAWQFQDEARLTAFGNLACDLDSAAMRDPSAPTPAVAPSPATIHAPADVRPPAPFPAPPDVPPVVARPTPAVIWPWLLLGAIVIVSLAVWAYFRHAP